MTETNLGWHQVGCSRCVDQRRRTTCHQMKSACAVRGASHCQLISFLDVGQRWDDKTLTLGITLSRSVCARRAAYITYRLHAAYFSLGGEGNALYPVLSSYILWQTDFCCCVCCQCQCQCLSSKANNRGCLLATYSNY